MFWCKITNNFEKKKKITKITDRGRRKRRFRYQEKKRKKKTVLV
jgi:hypothetical protein